MKRIEVFSEEFMKFKIPGIYLKIECPNCHNTWGVTVINGQIEAKSLICRNCISENILNH